MERCRPVLLGADPPRHAAVRRVVARSFGVAAIARLEELARTESDHLIDEQFDGAVLARSISRSMAASLIGFPPDALSRITEAEQDPDETHRLERLFTVLDEEAPSAEVYGRLLADGADVLTPEQARSVVRLLWLASTVTTERAIAHAALRLATHNVLQARFRDEPALVLAYVDEIIRLFPPEMIIRRIAVEAVTIDGATIPAGAELLVCPGAAGRDAAVHELPDELDLTRQTRGLSFGHSPHMRIGGPLARRVIAATVERLLAPGPAFALDADYTDLPYTRTMAVLAPNHVPIRMQMGQA
jgi:cytochrome P450